jgi:hypothetical protein
MTDKQFVNGMIVKRGDNAPDYVLANLSIKRGELVAFLDQQPGDWVNVSLKRAKSGKCYAELDTWKPTEKLADVARGPAAAPVVTNDDSDIPF